MDDYRSVVVHHPTPARRDAHMGAEAVARLETLLAKMAAGEATACQIQHPLMKRFGRELKSGQRPLNATTVREDAKYDGKYVVRTTSALKGSDVVAAYKTLQRLEQGFRTMKTILRVRPMDHHAAQRIISHVKLCVLAYFLVCHAEVTTGHSWEQVVRLFRPLHGVELITKAGVVFRRSELTPEQKTILKVLGISLSKEIPAVHLPS